MTSKTPTPPPAPVDLDGLAAERRRLTPRRVTLDVSEDRLVFRVYCHDPAATHVEAHALINAMGAALTAAKKLIPERTGRHGDWMLMESGQPERPGDCAFQLACTWERRHTQPTEGASACGSSSHDQEQSA